MNNDEVFLNEAYLEALKGYEESGIPIGSVLVYDGKIIGRGHNLRVQKGSAILHAEMSCLETAGRLSSSVYRQCTIYSTLSPCPMCSGAIMLYKIPRVVIGENKTFLGHEDIMKQNGIEVIVLNDEKCMNLMERFIKEKPEVWSEDIGV